MHGLATFVSFTGNVVALLRDSSQTPTPLLCFVERSLCHSFATAASAWSALLTRRATMACRRRFWVPFAVMWSKPRSDIRWLTGHLPNLSTVDRYRSQRVRHEYEYCDVCVNRSDDNMLDVCFQESQLTSDPTTTPQQCEKGDRQHCQSS